jgi:netrin 1
LYIETANEMFLIKLIFSFVFISSLCSANRWYRTFNSNHDDPCIDRHKRFQRCIPDFINAAYQKPIYVSSTCGNSPKEFCSLSELNKNQPIDYLTDINNPNNLTCWQSDLIKQGDNISLVLSLKKKFELTYISLQFCSKSKPDSMAIFKSMDMVS